MHFLPDTLYLLVNSIGLPAADAVGLAPGRGEEWAQALEAYVAQAGKFSKLDIVYVPVQPPPFFWDYNCGRCKYWTEPNGCTLVEGWVARGGWCAIYMPPAGVKPFTWPVRVIQDAPRWLAEAPQAFQNWFQPAPAPKDGGPPP